AATAASSDRLDLIEVGAVTFGFHAVARNEPQGRRVDAVAQPAAVLGTVVENMAEMAIPGGRAHLGANHAVRGILKLPDIGRLDPLGEARPAAAGFVLVRGREQRLARDDIDVDAGLLVVEVFTRAWPLGAALLRHAKLLRRQTRNRLRRLAIVALVVACR